MTDDSDLTLSARQAADSELDADQLDDGALADPADPEVDPAPDQDAVEQVVDEVRDEIRHGQVEDDTSHVLEERLEEAGVHIRPEVVDDLAEDLENDVSS